MEILNYSTQNLARAVLDVAIYQKVVVIFDNKFGENVADNLRSEIKKDTQFFATNFFCAHKDELLVGAKCVVEILSHNNYFSLIPKLDNVTLISVAEKVASIRTASKIVFTKSQKNLADLLIFANTCIEGIWRENCGGYTGEEYLKIFKKTCQNFFDTKCSNTNFLKEIFVVQDVLEETKYVKNLSIYLYARIVAIAFLFLSFERKCITQIDVYKECAESVENINICHQLMTDEKVMFLLRHQNKNINKIIGKIIQKIKLKNCIKIEKINIELNNLKNNVKCQKYDNLLKYCYFFGIFDKI